MSYLALCDSLVKEYWRYKFDDKFNKEKIRKLFKYIRPFLVSKSQMPIQSGDIILITKQLESDPLLRCIGDVTEEMLVKFTKLKLMLIDKDMQTNFFTINIMNNDIKVNFTASYKARQNRKKARIHIKSLLEDAQYIRVVDKYMAYDRCWNICKDILKEIIPDRNVKIKLLTTDETGSKSISGEKKRDFQQLSSNWHDVEGGQLDWSKIHDRYIETDTLKIILSSGIENLLDNGLDLTYVVEVKSGGV
jgi:hypothetical protein